MMAAFKKEIVNLILVLLLGWTNWQSIQGNGFHPKWINQIIVFRILTPVAGRDQAPWFSLGVG